MPKKNHYIEKVDKLIGKRVYLLRLAKGLSCEQLASMISVSDKQMYKYENAQSRMSTGRLMLIAKALKIDVAYFLQDVENIESSDDDIDATRHQHLCIAVSRNFLRIKSKETQRIIHELAKDIVKTQDEKTKD
jgi:transcriptional regulator with XRE-family HTH domain